MKADTVDLAAIFGKHVRYVVPLFQRPYVWKRDKHWEPLWEDIQAVANRQLDDTPANDSIPHFMGAVVLEQSLTQAGMVESRAVIDGQQRLTTLQLVLAAARSLATDWDMDDSRQMFEKLLFNETFLVRHDGDQMKVLPTDRDRAAFREAVEGQASPKTYGHPIHQAFRFFRGSISEWATDGTGDGGRSARMEALGNVLWRRLLLVTIDLDPGDNAQVIFETLNARGTPLLAGDLIKNHLFQTATAQGADIETLYDEHWKILDGDWWRQEIQQGRLKRPRLDAFLTHWLAMRTGAEVVSHDLFPSFKRYLADGPKSAGDVLLDLQRYASVYESFETEPETTARGRFLYRLRVMEVTTAYPALLWLLGPQGIPDRDEQQLALDGIESWLVRRMLTRATTKNYNAVFLALLNAVRLGGDPESPRAKDVVSHLAKLSGDSQEWPNDEAVVESLRGLPVYKSLTRARLRMVLEALEEAKHTDLTEAVVLPHNLTIEHVLPQEWRANWPLPEGDEPLLANARRESAKHTLGNLTLLTQKLNSRQSNGPWQEKREDLRTHSVLLISNDLRAAETWDEAAIAERGEHLAQMTATIWSHPDDGSASHDGSGVVGERVQAELAQGSDLEPGPPPFGEIEAAVAGLPEDVRRVVLMRGSPGAAVLSARFGSAALAIEGVELRAQASKGDPWYYQVRHSGFRHVVAYVNPLVSGMRIEYRLPSDHDTYGKAWSRNNSYGISLYLEETDDLEVALRLLDDALTWTE